MNKQTYIAVGIDIDYLIGRTVYFEPIARKICVNLSKDKAGKSRMIYNLISGRVLGKNDTWTGIMLQSPDGTLSNRNIWDA